MGQFSLFGAAAAEPTLADLDGVLLGGGLWSRRSDVARLSVVVDARWRAEVLAVEFVARGLRTVADPATPGALARPEEVSPGSAGAADSAGSGASAAAATAADSADSGASAAAATAAVASSASDGWSVRTDFVPALLAPAARWSQGALDGAPADLDLTPGALRLWAITRGHADDSGYLLGARDSLQPAAGVQLARLGVTAVAITRRGRTAYRVTGARRLRRLAELLGPAPSGGEGDWPVLS